MKIVIFGEDVFTIAVFHSLISNGHEIAAIVCPAYRNNYEYRNIEKTAQKESIFFLHQENINDDNIQDHLDRINPDLIVCVHLKKILSKSIFSKSGRGAINVHPSLLPKYRGLSPQHQTLLNGDLETGVTIHFIDEGVDTGDIIIQEKIPLTKETYISELLIKMLSIYQYLIVDAIKLIMTDNFKPLKQDVSKASWYGALKDRDRKIDLKKTKFEIYNLIRAVSKPYKGAYYDNIIIWSSVFADIPTENELLQKYKNVGVYHDEDNLVLRLHDGILLSDDFEIDAK